VRSLVDHIWENTATECVEHDGALTSVNVEQTRIDGEGTDGESAGARRKASQYFIHYFSIYAAALGFCAGLGWALRKIYAAAALVCGGEWRVVNNGS